MDSRCPSHANIDGKSVQLAVRCDLSSKKHEFHLALGGKIALRWREIGNGRVKMFFQDVKR